MCRAATESMPPGRPTARRTSCSCIHTSSGRLRSRVRQSQPTPPKIGSGLRVGVGRRVGEQRVCRAVAAERISLMIASRAGVAAVDDADLGVEAHQAGDVVRLADVGGLLRAAGEDATRGGRCARRRPSRPSPAGRSASTTPPSSSSSRRSVKSLIACHHTSTYPLSSSWSVMRSTLGAGRSAGSRTRLVVEADGEDGDVVGEPDDTRSPSTASTNSSTPGAPGAGGRPPSAGRGRGDVLAAALDQAVGVEQQGRARSDAWPGGRCARCSAARRASGRARPRRARSPRRPR